MALWIHEGTHDSREVVPICGDAIHYPYCVCIDCTVHSLLLPNLLAVRDTEERLRQPVVVAVRCVSWTATAVNKWYLRLLSLPPSQLP